MIFFTMDKKRLSLGLLAFMFSMFCAVPAFAWMTFFGNYQLAEQQSGEFLQSYNHSTSLSFAQTINEISLLREDIRYTEQWREKGNRRETVTPSFGYGLGNEFVDVNLNAHQVDEYNANGINNTSKAWDAQLNSKWSKLYVPDFYVSYGQSFSKTTDDPVSNDYQTDTANGTVDLDLNKVQLFYGLNWSDGEDKLTGKKNTLTAHLARASTQFAFLENRVSFSLSHQYNLDENKRPTVSFASKNFLKQTGISVRTLQSATPASLSFASMTNQPGLYDTVLTVVAQPIIKNDKDWNIALDLSLQETDAIFLYYDPLSTVVAGDLVNMQVWASDDGLTWTQVNGANVTVSFDSSNDRFIIEFDNQLTAANRYVKIVFDSPSITANDVNITEIEAYRIVNTVTNNAKTTREKNQTNAGTQIKISKDLRLGYNFSLLTTDNDPEEPRTSEARSHSGTLTYSPVVEFVTKLSVSDYISKIEGFADRENRSYGVDFLTVPLETVDMRFGASRNENYENDVKLSVSDYYEINTDARLYPDLNSHVQLYYQTVEDAVSLTKTKTYTALADIIANLTPKVTLNASGNYSDAKSTTEVENFIGTTGLVWRISDTFSFTLTGRKIWVDWHGDLESMGMSVVLSPTRKVQLNMSYSASVRDSLTTNSANSSLRWTLSKNLFFNVRTNYTNSRLDEEIFLVDGSLSFRFSAL